MVFTMQDAIPRDTAFMQALCADHQGFSLHAALRELKIKGVPVLAFRISYVGEQGWELQFELEDGLALRDARHAAGAVETHTA